MKANIQMEKDAPKKKKAIMKTKMKKNNIQDYLENKYQKLTGQKKG